MHCRVQQCTPSEFMIHLGAQTGIEMRAKIVCQLAPSERPSTIKAKLDLVFSLIAPVAGGTLSLWLRQRYKDIKWAHVCSASAGSRGCLAVYGLPHPTQQAFCDEVPKNDTSCKDVVHIAASHRMSNQAPA